MRQSSWCLRTCAKCKADWRIGEAFPTLASRLDRHTSGIVERRYGANVDDAPCPPDRDGDDSQSSSE